MDIVYARHWLLAAGLTALFYAAYPLPAWAQPRPTMEPVTLTAEGVQVTAQVGNSTLSEYNRADILLLALDKGGKGVSGLASNSGNGSSVINLSSGWAVDTVLVPPGGCLLRPTRLLNFQEGLYLISLISASSSGPCPWSAGDYVFNLRIQNVTNTTNGVVFNGSVIGRVTLR